MKQVVRRVALGHQEIDPPVVVVVDQGDLPRLHAGEIDAPRSGDIGEVLPVALVAIQLVRRRRSLRKGDIDVDVPAVTVEIAARRAAGVDRVGKTGLAGDVGERPAAAIE